MVFEQNFWCDSLLKLYRLFHGLDYQDDEWIQQSRVTFYILVRVAIKEFFQCIIIIICPH